MEERVAITHVTCLKDEGVHDLATLRVLVAELAAVRLVLLDRPDSHLSRRNNREEKRGRRRSHDSDHRPGEHLKEVVRAADQAEETAIGDLAHARTRRTEPAQNQVRMQVAKLRQRPQRNHEREELGVVTERAAYSLGTMVRRVDTDGQKHARKQPVVSRVLKDVEHGHGCVGETVHEDRLELALDKVNQHKDERDSELAL